MHIPLLYGVENTVRFPVVRDGSSGHAGSADWSPTVGDLKICQDDIGPTNTTNLPTESPAGSKDWKLVLTAAECTGKLIRVRIANAALTDQRLDFFTHGHASAYVVRNLNIVDVTHWANSAVATPGTAGYPQVTIKDGGLSHIKRNQALAKYVFVMLNATTKAPQPGLIVTCVRSIDGAADATGTLANIDEHPAADGRYLVDFGAGDLNGKVIVLKATATGALTTFERIITVP
jgi:hypothetical protein